MLRRLWAKNQVKRAVAQHAVAQRQSRRLKSVQRRAAIKKVRARARLRAAIQKLF